ncbi:MAG: hypothetical protein WBA07_16135 [Rivularia sp. (in: cyanobacteria)]
MHNKSSYIYSRRLSFLSSIKHSSGISLILVGQPIGWAIRDLSGQANNQLFSFALMFIGLILLVYTPNLTSTIVKFPFLIFCKKSFFYPLSFLIPSLFAAFHTNLPGDIEPLYISFVICFLVALETVPSYRIHSLPQNILIISFSGCLLSIYLILLFGTELSGQRLELGNTNSPGPVAMMSATAIISGFFCLNSFNNTGRIFYKLLLYLTILMASFVFFITLKRSTLIGLLLCILVPIIKALLSFISLPKKQNRYNYNFKKKSLFKIILPIIIICISVYVLRDYLPNNIKSLIDILYNYIERLFDYFWRGLESLIYGTGNEQSAATRRINLQKAFAEWTIQGNGYKSLYVDAPVVQAFYDGGIIGGTVFFLVAFIIPTCHVFYIFFNIKNPNTIKVFCSYIYLLYFPSLFSNGQPYEFFMWLRIVLLYRVLY